MRAGGGVQRKIRRNLEAHQDLPTCARTHLNLILKPQAPVADLFDFVRPNLEGPLTLILERDLVIGIDCPTCDWSQQVYRPRTKVGRSEAFCPTCQVEAPPTTAHEITEGSPLLSRTLAEVGIPPYDIVRIDGAGDSRFLLLANDRDAAQG